MSRPRAALLATLAALGAAAAACRPDGPLAPPTAQVAAQQAIIPCRWFSLCRLAFGIQPSDTRTGATMTPPVVVRILNGLGNPVSSFNGRVTIAIGANPGGGRLAGTLTVRAQSGVARFTDLSIDRPGTGYTLVATSASLLPAMSAPFTIADPATHLGFTVQPSMTVAGSFIAPPVQVAALDDFGNIDPGFPGDLDLAVAVNPGGGFLSGDRSQPLSAGVATFADLSIDKAGAGYTLQATTPGLPAVISAQFAIVPGAATQLVFITQPSNTAAGFAIAPSVRVAAVDAFGNIATAFTGNVTIAIAANPSGGLLSGTTIASAVNGIVTFADLKISLAGQGYTLEASSAGLTGATSVAFDIL